VQLVNVGRTHRTGVVRADGWPNRPHTVQTLTRLTKRVEPK